MPQVQNRKALLVCTESSLVISCLLSTQAGETKLASPPPENIVVQPFLQLGQTCNDSEGGKST